MANRTQEFTTTIFLNDKQAKDEIAALDAKVKAIRKGMDEAANVAKKTGDWTDFNKLKKELNQTTKQLNSMRTSAQQVDHVLENLNGASVKEIRNTIRAINRELASGNIDRGSDKWNFLNNALRQCNEELKKIKAESAALAEQEEKSSFWKRLTNLNQIGFAITNFFGLEQGITGIIGKVQSLAQESMDVAKNAEGIEIAFQRINKPGLLDNLRKATHGTIDDIQLMQQAVKFQNFDLPVEQLGKLLAFAQQTAKDTGQSIDYMVNSIVDGLSRQSAKILDNLGLSATKIKEKVAETGDFTTGVIAMIEERMGAMGEYTETASDRAARATAKVVNAQKELGEQLLPIRSRMASVFGQAKLGMLDALTWILKNRDAFVTLAKVVGIWAATMTAAMAVDRLAVIQAKLHAAVTTTHIALTKAWTVATNYLKTSLVAFKLVVALCTGGVNAYTAALEKAKAASMTNPWTALATVLLTVGTAIYGVIKRLQNEREAAKKAADATNIFLLNQKNMQSVIKKANASVSEEVTRLNTLYRKLKDSKAAYDERKKALDEIQKLVPTYHGAITKEGQLLNDNIAVLKEYCNNLVKAARAQAAFGKMVEIQERAMSHQTLLEGRQSNQRWVLQQMAKFGYDPTQGDTWGYLYGQGVTVRDRHGNKKGDKLSDDQVKQLNHLQYLYNYNEKRIGQEETIVNLLQKQTEELQKYVDVSATSSNTGVNTGNGDAEGGNKNTKNSSSGGVSDNSGHTETLEEILEKKEKAITQSAERDQVMLTLNYRQGLIEYKDYLAQQTAITKKSLDDRVQLYIDNNATNLNAYIKALKDRSDFEEQQKEQQQEDKKRKNETDIERWRLNEVFLAKKSIDDEDALNDKLFEIDQQALAKRLALYKDSPKEYDNISLKISENEQKHQLELQRRWRKTISDIQRQYKKLSLEEQEKTDISLLRSALKYTQDQLDSKMALYAKDSEEYKRLALEKEAIEKQYQEWITETETDYARKRMAQRSQEQKDAKMSDAAARGFDKAGLSDKPITSSSGSDGINGFVGAAGTVATALDAFAKLKEAKEQNLIDDEEWAAAKKELWKELWHNLPETAMAAFSAVQTYMQADAAYTQANCDYKVAMITKEYDDRIEKAGSNSAKVQKLEKERDKKIAAEKNKANKKAMKVEIAQAFASTAMAAINAYNSAAEVPIIGYILAPIAAAAALAFGAMQIATIKKQHQAEAAGYYEGGFTGGSSYRREAGVVHEGEFVANHNTVNNPQLLPALQLIDLAQRNNTVGSLTAADVSRSMGVGSAAIVSAPTVVINNDNEELSGTLQQTREAIGILSSMLASGQIIVKMPDWDEFDRSRRHYDNLQSNK